MFSGFFRLISTSGDLPLEFEGSNALQAESRYISKVYPFDNMFFKRLARAVLLARTGHSLQSEMILKQVCSALEKFQSGEPCEVCDGMLEVIASCRTYLRCGNNTALRVAVRKLNYLRRNFGIQAN